jgi:hypothetical protein
MPCTPEVVSVNLSVLVAWIGGLVTANTATLAYVKWRITRETPKWTKVERGAA